MAIADDRLIEILISEDDELKRCVSEHEKLDFQIRKMNQQRFLTPREEMERKTLQKKKLAGKDRIQQILIQYRKNERVIF
jgi:uncharacterized protein YdcH (DUF465 family)